MGESEGSHSVFDWCDESKSGSVCRSSKRDILGADGYAKCTNGILRLSGFCACHPCWHLLCAKGSVMNASPRPLSLFEKELLGLLLREKFPGWPEIQAQLVASQVVVSDEYGSVEFVKTSGPKASVVSSVPVSARVPDSNGISEVDGPCVNVLLHVQDGKVRMLEIYKDDGTRIHLPLLMEKADVFAPES